MKDVAHQIRSIITTAESKLSRMNLHEVGYKPASDEWSKKEILGHLIDSAANNHQRFVRAVYKVADQFPTYNQEEWVRIQQYNETSWPALIAFWSGYNHHLCHVIENVPGEALSSPCNIGNEAPVSLEFVIRDYPVHLKHHLKDILGESL